MNHLAVVLQVVAVIVGVVAAGFLFDSWWGSVLVGSVVVFAVGAELERR